MSGPKGMPVSLRAAVTVAARDLLEFVRDRRTLVVTLLMPMAMYPVLALSSTLGVRTAVSDQESRRASARLAVVVSGAEAEAFAARLQTAAAEVGDDAPANVSIVPLPEDAAADRIAVGEADAWLVLPHGAVAGLDGDGTVEAEARLAPAVWEAGAAARVQEQLMQLVRRVADEARVRRVARAGLPRTVLVPISVRFADTARGGTSFRDVVPTVGGAVLVLLALLTATGAFYPAIDAIAGEKERGTIETLLVAPCRSADVVLGKFLAVLAVTVVTLATNALSIALTGAVLLRFLPEGTSLGLRAGEIAGCAAVAIVSYLGLAAIAAALCLAVTSAARSVKEAQNTLTPVILLVSGLAGAALLPGVSGRPLLAAVPFAGQVALARSMLVPPEAGTAAVSVASRLVGILPGMLVSMAASLGVVWILLAATAAAVSDEEILFRGPDSVRHGLQRPAARRVPSVGQGCAAMALALAALWYAQGLAPDDLAAALPLHQALVTILPLGLLSWWQRVDTRRTFRALFPGRGMGAVAACAAAAVVGVGVFLAGAWLMLVVTGGEPGPETRRLAERLLALLGQRPAWLVWLLVALVPAVCEEMFFRGWVLAAFAGDPPRSGRAVRAVVAQAACFALVHLLPERMTQTFTLGLVLGWMTLRSGSILPAMVAHAAHNATPLVLHALCGAAVAHGSTAGAPGWMPGLAVGCLAVGAAMFVAATGWRSAVSAASAA